MTYMNDLHKINNKIYNEISVEAWKVVKGETYITTRIEIINRLWNVTYDVAADATHNSAWDSTLIESSPKLSWSMINSSILYAFIYHPNSSTISLVASQVAS